MGQGRINEALAWPTGFGRGRAPVTAKPGAWLRTRYADDEIEAMAQEDGEVGLLGPPGGPGTRVLHGELGSAGSVCHWCAGRPELPRRRLGEDPGTAREGAAGLPVSQSRGAAKRWPR